MRWLWLPALLGFACYQFLVWNPLPGDEEMIAHFRAHRAEFEELARRYRSYEREPDGFYSAWMKEGDTPMLLERASVRDVSAGGPFWLPDPYEIETAKSVDKLLKDSITINVPRRFGALVFRPAQAERYYGFHPLRLDIWKDYYFVPQVPRIESGELLWPVNSEGKYQSRRRVFSSLDKLPVR